jgi:hypothetical protein
MGWWKERRVMRQLRAGLITSSQAATALGWTVEREQRTPVSLSQQERQELQATWPVVMCRDCGLAHPGACPRVRRIVVETSPNTTKTDTWYWANDEWEPPPGAMTAEEVWGTGVPVPPTRCEAHNVDSSKRCELQVGHDGEHSLIAA